MRYDARNARTLDAWMISVERSYAKRTIQHHRLLENINRCLWKMASYAAKWIWDNVTICEVLVRLERSG
jgi:hypothetical protein